MTDFKIGDRVRSTMTGHLGVIRDPGYIKLGCKVVQVRWDHGSTTYAAASILEAVDALELREQRQRAEARTAAIPPAPQANAGASLAAIDMVNQPPHYTQHPSGIECIQITEHMGFNLGNAFKYIWRADLKNGLEDLKKARYYVDREIAKREKQAAKSSKKKDK